MSTLFFDNAKKKLKSSRKGAGVTPLNFSVTLLLNTGVTRLAELKNSVLLMP